METPDTEGVNDILENGENINQIRSNLHWTDSNGQGSLDMSHHTLLSALESLLRECCTSYGRDRILGGSFRSGGEIVATAAEVREAVNIGEACGYLDTEWIADVLHNLDGSTTTMVDLANEWLNVDNANVDDERSVWTGNCWLTQEECDEFRAWVEEQA